MPHIEDGSVAAVDCAAEVVAVEAMPRPKDVPVLLRLVMVELILFGLGQISQGLGRDGCHTTPSGKTTGITPNYRGSASPMKLLMRPFRNSVLPSRGPGRQHDVNDASASAKSSMCSAILT